MTSTQHSRRPTATTTDIRWTKYDVLKAKFEAVFRLLPQAAAVRGGRNDATSSSSCNLVLVEEAFYKAFAKNATTEIYDNRDDDSANNKKKNSADDDDDDGGGSSISSGTSAASNARSVHREQQERNNKNRRLRRREKNARHPRAVAVVGDISQLLERWIACARRDYRFEVAMIEKASSDRRRRGGIGGVGRRLPFVGDLGGGTGADGCWLHILVRAERYDEVYFVRYAALYRSNRVQAVELLDVDVRGKVVGQRRADKHRRVGGSRGFPTELEMASRIRSLLPDHDTGNARNISDDKLLVRDEEFRPLRLRNEVLHLSLELGSRGTRRIDTPMSIRGAEDGQRYAGGAYFLKTTGAALTRFVLCNCRDEKVAYCVTSRAAGSFTNNIYGRYPLRRGDVPELTTMVCDEAYRDDGSSAEDVEEFYPWYRINGSSRMPFVSIDVWEGNDGSSNSSDTGSDGRSGGGDDSEGSGTSGAGGYAPFLRAIAAEDKSTMRTCRSFVVMDNGYEPCGYVRKTKKRYGTGGGTGGGGVETTIAPGVDPALMLCLSLVIG